MEQQINKPPYAVLIVLLIGSFIAMLNNTLLNIALPSIMKDLDIVPATVQWLSTGYMLVNGILVPTTAFLIQKFSARHLFIVSMSLFLMGTIIAGFAHSFPLLLGGRLFQASGSAIMMPLLMNTILTGFPIEKRGSVMGLLGLVMMGAPAIGPTLSGWIVEHFDWRMLFHFITPIAVISLIIGAIFLKDKKAKSSLTLDGISVILSSFGFGGLLYGFSSAGNKGWDSPQVYISLIVGVITLVMFITRQIRSEKPMLNFKIYKYPMYALSSAISVVLSMAMFSAMLLLPIYIQTLRGISPFKAGLMLLPGALVMALLSPITGKLFDKFGGRILAITGLTIMVIATYDFSNLSFETSYTYLIFLYTFRMLGMALVMMPVMTNGLNQLPARFYPHGTAMNNTLQQVSGAIGSSVLVTIMTNRAESVGKDMAADMVKSGATMTAQLQQQISAKAMLEGINFSFFVSVFIAVVALILAFFIKRAKQAEEIANTKQLAKESV